MENRKIKAHELELHDTFLSSKIGKQMFVWKKMPVKIKDEVKVLIVLPGSKQIIFDPEEVVNLLYRVADLAEQT